MDSSISNFHIGDGLPELPPLKHHVGQQSPSNSMDGKIFEIAMEFRNGEFSAEELKKIMESERLL